MLLLYETYSNGEELPSDDKYGGQKLTAVFIVRPRACFHCVVFRVPKNGTLETKKPPAMQVSQHCFSLQ